MPYSPKAHRFFEAVAHGMKPKNKNAPSKEEAKKLASEGVKSEKKTRLTKLYGSE